MRRTFALDVLCCPRCAGRLRFVALMTEPKEICRYLRALGERDEGLDLRVAVAAGRRALDAAAVLREVALTLDTIRTLPLGLVQARYRVHRDGA